MGAYEDETIPFLILGLIIGVVLCVAFFFIFLNDSPLEDLNIDKNKIAKQYVLIYYPEYENCSAVWDKDLESDCRTCPISPGVRIYCNDIKDDRDGLKIHRESILTEEIIFEDVTLEEAFEILIENKLDVLESK